MSCPESGAVWVGDRRGPCRKRRNRGSALLSCASGFTTGMFLLGRYLFYYGRSERRHSDNHPFPSARFWSRRVHELTL